MPVGHDGRDTREKHSGKLAFIDLCTLICEIYQKSETGLSPSWYQMICVRYYLRHLFKYFVTLPIILMKTHNHMWYSLLGTRKGYSSYLYQMLSLTQTVGIYMPKYFTYLPGCTHYELIFFYRFWLFQVSPSTEFFLLWSKFYHQLNFFFLILFILLTSVFSGKGRK